MTNKKKSKTQKIKETLNYELGFLYDLLHSEIDNNGTASLIAKEIETRENEIQRLENRG